MTRYFGTVGLCLLLHIMNVGDLVAGSPGEVHQFSDTDVQKRWDQDGKSYVLVDGDIYRERRTGGYTHVISYYDPDYFELNYDQEGDAHFQVFDDSGIPSRIRLANTYSDDMESYEDFTDLLITRNLVNSQALTETGVAMYDYRDFPTRWSSLTLQSPRTPTVSDYVDLRTSILEHDGEFLDNRVDLARDRSFSGIQSLRFYSAAPDASMVTAKSSIATESVIFRNGDVFSFSGMFYFDTGMPTTIMDLESTWLEGHSGIRILFSPQGAPSVELKAFDKPMIRNRDYRVPRNQWVRIDARIQLDDVRGLVRLWINDDLVLDGFMPTMPLPDVVLNSVEIGISATSEETILYVDDVVITQSPQ